MENALRNLGYFLTWLDPEEGWLPWFEHNQGFLSVLALGLTAVALWWEFRQARDAERKAAAAVAEIEAKDRQASLTARKKEREDRISHERDDIIKYCVVVNDAFEALQRAVRVELHRLAYVEPGGHAIRRELIAEGRRVKRSVEALMARPPPDQDAILATCQGLEVFEDWERLATLFDPEAITDALTSSMQMLGAAQARLRDALEGSVKWAREQILTLYEED